MDDPFEVASRLDGIVDGVRASDNRIVVAYAPDERHEEKLPLELYGEVMSVIEGTIYQHEYTDADHSTVERHSWTGGRSNPVLSPSDQPAGYELQVSFVK